MECGHSLTGLPERGECPECGAAFTPETRFLPARPTGWQMVVAYRYPFLCAVAFPVLCGALIVAAHGARGLLPGSGIEAVLKNTALVVFAMSPPLVAIWCLVASVSNAKQVSLSWTRRSRNASLLSPSTRTTFLALALWVISTGTLAVLALIIGIVSGVVTDQLAPTAWESPEP